MASPILMFNERLAFSLAYSGFALKVFSPLESSEYIFLGGTNHIAKKKSLSACFQIDLLLLGF